MPADVPSSFGDCAEPAQRLKTDGGAHRLPLAAAVRAFGQRMLRMWGRETFLHARLINIGHLLAGSFFGSIIGMVAFVVTARALGPADYGLLALAYSYGRAVHLLVGFQSWQPLIKYGAELQEAGRHDDYRSLLKFGLLLDVAAAVIAFLVAVGLALAFGPLVGVSEEAMLLVLIYSSTLLFQINGFPTAVMRLAGRFWVVAYGSQFNTVLRLVLCLIGLLTGAQLLYFVIVWTVTQIVGSLVILVLAFIEIRRQGVDHLLSAPLSGISTRFKGLWTFTIGSNIELTVRSSASQFDTLIVGALAGPAAAGFYHIAKRLGRVVVQCGVQVQAVLYPDVARLWARMEVASFRRTVLQMEILLITFGVAVVAATWLGIQPLLRWTAGPEFMAAAPLATVQMVAVAMTLSGSAVRTALLAMGRQPAILKIVLGATIVFHITALTAIPIMGAMGANIAHIAMSSVWLAALMLVYHKALKDHPNPA